MAKVYGPSGLITGKMGGGVYAIRNGVQVWRQYNPVVMNPKSEAQQIVRARLKLLSQLSASLQDSIAFRREGAVSPRNLFTKTNYRNLDEIQFEDGAPVALINLESIDLTGGVKSLPTMATPTATASSVSVALAAPAGENIEKVFYAVYGVKDGTRLNEIGLLMVEVAGTNREFPATIQGEIPSEGSIVIYAYGVQFVSTQARTAYENYKAVMPAEKASLKVIQYFGVNDVVLTETRSVLFNLA